MGRKRWEKNLRKRNEVEENVRNAKERDVIISQGKYLDALNAQVAAATPEEAEALKKRLLDEFLQDLQP